MLDVRRLPSAVVAATFALSGVVATTGVVSVATGVGQGSSAFCSNVDDTRPAGDILECMGGSTAYISTPIGSGSGLVLEHGYLLTNSHVVDPFTTVDVTLGKEVHKDVPVVGVDLFSDIAVIGPIETKARPVDLVDPSGMKEGEQLFLVGYPGEANTEDLKPTVADGILSRTRASEAFGLHYLQTDASIGGGQSGGALVDRDGGVVGISSLRFAENFALALSGADAQASVDKILAGKGSPYESFPGAGQPTGEATLQGLPGDYEPQILSVPVAAEDRVVQVEVPADLPVMVVTGSLEHPDDALQVMGNLRPIVAVEADVPLAYVGEVPLDALQDEIPDAPLAELVSPGVFKFKVPANQHVLFSVLTNQEDPLSTSVKLSIPFVQVELGDPKPVALELGHLIEDTVGTLIGYDAYTVHLEAGQQIRVEASSPSGDMQVNIESPAGHRKELEDSRVGLYGVDVDETYEAVEAGDYLFEVGQVSDAPTGYHFTVSAK